MADSMIERVARALAKEGELPERMWQEFIEPARAAIQAMREPTEEMVEAAYENALDENAAGVWRTMIDTALTTGKSDD